MKTKQLLDLIKQKSIQIPLLLYKQKDKLKLDSDEFIFLMYLISFGDKFLFDLESVIENLNIDKEKAMKYFSKLVEENLISLEVVKNNDGVLEEWVLMDKFWNKALALTIDKINDNVSDKDNSTIYDRIQKEFGRMLTPIEYEIIGAWLSSNISEELIQEALKEAVFNGVNNLRYIDKILYEWGKKGYKTKSDIEKQREKWKGEKIEKKTPVKKDVFDYNWLEDDE